MLLAFKIGLRYTRAKRKNHFISFISLVSMLGIALGVAVLITVLSVMNGFDQEIRGRILEMVPHVMINALDGKMKDWQELSKDLKKLNQVKAVSPVIYGQGMLSVNGENAFSFIQGINPSVQNNVLPLKNKLIAGHWSDLKPGKFGVMLGENLAARLNVSVGDRVLLILPRVSMTPVGVLPRLKQLTVAGIFRVGYQFDNSYALMNLQDAARLFSMGSAVSGLQVRLSDLYLAPAIVAALNQKLPEALRAMDWTAQNPSLFKALKMEKTMMFFILVLIIAVAAFNMLSTLVMLVTDKQGDIAILKTLGAKTRTVMLIFITQGMVTGVIGTGLGVIGGMLLSWNVTTIVNTIQRIFHVQFLSASIYWVDYVPSVLDWHDVVEISITALFLSLLATLYPSWRASRIQPAEVLRYE